MKATVTFPIPRHAKLYISPGDKINPQTFIAEESAKATEEILHLARIMNVNPVNIYQYFKKQLGEYVKKGEVIAEKKGILSSCIVRSPVSAKLVSIDIKKGTLSLLPELPKKIHKVFFPFAGIVKKIDKAFLEVEIEGIIFTVVKGAGKEVTGKLNYFGERRLQLLDISSDVDNSIVACQDVSEDTLVKLDVLGARGLILAQEPAATDISWVQAGQEIIRKLSAYNLDTIWLRPGDKQIIVQKSHL